MKNLLIKLDGNPSAERFMIAKGCGCDLIVAPNDNDNLEESLVWLKSTINGWM